MKFMAFFLLLFFLNPAFSEEENDDSILKSTMRKILNDPRVKPSFEKCKSDATKSAFDIEECLFKELTNNDPQALKFIVELLDQVKSEEEQKQGRENASKFSGKGLGTIKLRNDPVLKKIREQMTGKILETVFGDKGSLLNPNELRVVDQKTFIELYRSHLSKGFTDVVAGFCINVKIINNNVLEWKEDYHEQNMQALKANPGLEGEKFQQCITLFKHSCSYVASGNSCPKVQEVSTNGTLVDSSQRSLACSKDDDTQSKACEVLQYAEEIKQNIIASETLLKKWKELNSNAREGSLISSTRNRIKQYNGTTRAGDGSKSIQELTISTSKEIEGTLGKGQNSLYAKEGEALAQKCAQSIDAEGCDQVGLKQEKFDKQKEEVVEIGARMRAMEFKLEDSLNKISTGDQQAKDNLRALLQEEGFESGEALKIIDDPEKSKKVVADILKSYKEKRKSLIKSLSDRLQKKDPKNIQTRIQEVKESYKNKAKKMVELVHYSNVVASFLTVEKQDGSKSLNVFRAKQELKGLSSDLKDRKSAIEGSINSSGKDVKDDAAGGLTLQIRKINDILLKDTKQGQTAGGRQGSNAGQ